VPNLPPRSKPFHRALLRKPPGHNNVPRQIQRIYGRSLLTAIQSKKPRVQSRSKARTRYRQTDATATLISFDAEEIPNDNFTGKRPKNKVMKHCHGDFTCAASPKEIALPSSSPAQSLTWGGIRVGLQAKTNSVAKNLASATTQAQKQAPRLSATKLNRKSMRGCQSEINRTSWQVAMRTHGTASRSNEPPIFPSPHQMGKGRVRS